MRKNVIGRFVLALLIVSIPVFTQQQSPLVGMWEEVSWTIDGKDVPMEGAPPGVKRGVRHHVFTADGHYMNLCISTGRPILTTPPNERSKEELLSQFWGTMGQWGTYTISGDKLTIRPVAAMNPAVEGKDVVSTFRMEGAEVVLARMATGPKMEQRLRRVK
jgi:hypothetical protein